MERTADESADLIRHPSSDEVLDQAVALTFPASDPIAVEVAYARRERIRAARAKLRNKRSRKQPV